MQLRLKNAIQRSHRVRFLSIMTLALSIFSLTLYLPDIFKAFSEPQDHTEKLYDEYVHITLSCILAIISWFSFHSHQTQKQVFSIIEALPHSILLFSNRGKLITANLMGRNFIQEKHGADTVTYKKFIEHICLENLQQKNSFHHMNNPLLNNIKSRNAIFQDIYKSPAGNIFLIQCQETEAGVKFVLITDITKIYSLDQESHTLLTAVNLSPTGFALATHIGDLYNVFYFNSSYQILLGINRQQNALSEHIITLSSPGEWMNIDQALSNSMPYRFEGKIEEKGEKPRWLLCQLFPLKQDNQDIILIYINDITEQKIRDHQTQQSVRLETIGHLSSGIAHDFNNILAIIKGYQQLSTKEGLDRDTFLEYNNHIQIAIQRANLLTKQLLSFGDNKIALLNGKTDLVPQMRELEKLLSTLIHNAAKLNFLIPHDLQIRIACPVDIFTQIIMNLVINARDALPGGGSISVSAHIVDDTEREQLPSPLQKASHHLVCIQVSDNGTGIKPEHVAHIFDPFFTTKEATKGTGLGLSLIYKHLKDLNGHIRASSVLGEGTTMSVYLPIIQGLEVNSHIPQKNKNDLSLLKGKKIIITDDEAEIRYILSTTLKEWGCDVHEAEDGNAALSLQDEMEHVDILLTDIMMPNMNGLHLAHMFEQIRPETGTIFLSGYPKSDKDSAFKIPHDAIFLSKPISNEALQDALLSIVNKGDKYGRTTS